MKIGKKPSAVKIALNKLSKKSNGEDLSIGNLLEALSGGGQALLIVLASLPFCIPIQVPGFSTPFGLLIAFLGLQIAFGDRIGLPKKLLEKKISYEKIEKLAALATKMMEKLQFFTSPRLTNLLYYPLLHTLHGIVIAILGFILALPLPIPFSNLFTALPLLIMGLALLEDDGLLMLLAYLLIAIFVALIVVLIWLGKESLAALWG